MSLLQAREVWIARPSKAKRLPAWRGDRKSTRLNSSHGYISYAVFCLKKKKVTSLANQQCVMAIAGGVPIDTTINSGLIYEVQGPHSHDLPCGTLEGQAQRAAITHDES